MEGPYVFFVAGYKGFRVLEWFCQHYDPALVEAVYTAGDVKLIEDHSEAIRQLCRRQNLVVRDRRDMAEVRGVGFVIGWRWLLPSSGKLLIFHDSLLPRYRGFAPLVNALINGEREVGASLFTAVDEYDAGAIVFQERWTVEYPIRIKEAIGRMAECYCSLLEQALSTIRKGEPLPASAQDPRLATYSLWRDEEDYRIDWNWDHGMVRRVVDALGDPYPGARCMLGKESVIIDAVEEVEDVVIENRTPGKVIFQQGSLPVVVCGRGLVRIVAARASNGGKSILPLAHFRSRFY